MSPNSASRAEKLGYTNVKVYHDGIPVWTKKNFTVLNIKQLKEGWIEKDMPHVLVDVRPASEAEKGFIKGAVTIPAADVAKNIDRFPPKEKKPPIMIYDQKSGDDAKAAAKALVTAGYPMVNVITGGFDAWQAAGFPTEAGKLATTMAYVPKPRPGTIAIDEFKKLAASIPPDTILVDVRSQAEANEGMIKGARVIPDAEILDRLAELSRDKRIITYCNTGVQAEMTYHKLKEKGYNVAFLNAKVSFDDKGNYVIEP
ncbi:MAG: rhodanese-like domain-containing protein [Nitrospirota bacterium]|nr:rhodanese-like domain-containing protein [Nitrospirota bacterium]